MSNELSLPAPKLGGRACRRFPDHARWAIRRCQVRPTRHVLHVKVAAQSMEWWQIPVPWHDSAGFPCYRLRERFLISSSAFGIGQVMNSNQTPLGLHCVATKVGGGHPIGTVFRSRQAVGYTWQGLPQAKIAHRILWLAGLEKGFNQGGNVDTFARYVYLHGFGDETTLGRPNSHGCIHMAAGDLMPLYEVLPVGTLVYIEP